MFNNNNLKTAISKKPYVVEIRKILSGQLFKSIGIYGISNLVNSSLPFLFLLILTHYLTTSDYGIIANYQALFNLVLALVGFNVTGAIGRQYFKIMWQMDCIS